MIQPRGSVFSSQKEAVFKEMICDTAGSAALGCKTGESILKHPLFKMALTQLDGTVTQIPWITEVPIAIKSQSPRIIVGYASVELLDRQNDLIPIPALKDAFSKFWKAEDFRNVQILHTNIPVGKVIPEYTDQEGNVWRSGVDDQGLFIVVQLREDIGKADEVWYLIQQGVLAAFSIAGDAILRTKVCEGQKCYQRIDKLELHEISIVDRPANQGAVFHVVKQQAGFADRSSFAQLQREQIIPLRNSLQQNMKWHLPNYPTKKVMSINSVMQIGEYGTDSDWAGYVENSQHTWIAFVDKEGKPSIWLHRDKNGGVIGEPIT